MTRKVAFGLLLILIGILLITVGWTAYGSHADASSDPIVTADAWDGQLIRLHVVANSDSDDDQALKRAIRDAILADITPMFEGTASMEEAKVEITKAIPRINEIARGVIRTSGKAYLVESTVGRFEFPGKAYGEVFLPQGEYTALKVMIGEARGANWWCVLFPPMCFVDWTTGVVLEPAPGSGGARTVSVPRREVLTKLDGPALAKVPVRPRLAFLEWFRSKWSPKGF